VIRLIEVATTGQDPVVAAETGDRGGYWRLVETFLRHLCTYAARPATDHRTADTAGRSRVPGTRYLGRAGHHCSGSSATRSGFSSVSLPRTSGGSAGSRSAIASPASSHSMQVKAVWARPG
jgi:hypothetical protein